MTTFAGFDEAARLYIENHAVVKEMEKAYMENASRCLAAIEDAIEEQLAPVPFQKYSTPVYRYWWSGEDRYDQRPYLSFAHREPHHIDHRRIWLLAYAPPSASTRQVDALRGIRWGANLKPNERKGKLDLFDFTIDFEGEDFVESSARRLADILAELSRVFDGAGKE